MAAFKNIFRFYLDLENLIQTDIFKTSELIEFSQVFKNYLLSGVWSKSSEEMLICEKALRHNSNGDIMNVLHINKNTYYSRISRITERITNNIFGDSETFGKITQSLNFEVKRNLTDASNFVIQNSEAIIFTTKLVRMAMNKTNIYDDIDSQIMRKLEAHRKDSSDAKVTLGEQLKVLVFLANYSNTVMHNKIESLQPEALDKVISSLCSKSFTTIQEAYNILKNEMTEQRLISSELYEKIKSSIQGS